MDTIRDEDGLTLDDTEEDATLSAEKDLPDDKKSKKNKVRIEKHARLTRYFEDKRLREDLDFIDNW